MNWNWGYAWEILPDLLRGVVITIQVTFASATAAVIVGLFLAVSLRSAPRPVRMIVRLVVDFLRGTPVLVQLFFLFYALPAVGVVADATIVGILGLAIYVGAYLSEVFRASIDALPVGQWEAAFALRLPRLATWRRIIVPQVARMSLPEVGNYVILLFKYTPILVSITISEVLTAGLDIGARTYRYLEPLTMVGVLFIVVSVPCAVAIRALEHRYSRGRE